jgi:hypothetical protein
MILTSHRTILMWRPSGDQFTQISGGDQFTQISGGDQFTQISGRSRKTWLSLPGMAFQSDHYSSITL